MKTYSVMICRTSYAFTTVTINADSREQAEAQANDMAGDLDYTENNAECSVESITEELESVGKED